MADTLKRVEDPADPRRCQSTGTKNGQCIFEASAGSKYCVMHVGAPTIINRTINRNYRLTKWQARMEEFADNDKVKSLREEIGVIRMVLEETLNLCKDSSDLLMYSNKISDLVMKIEKLVVSCHRLEDATGMLIDKTQILQLATVIVDIVGKYIKNDNDLESISEGIITAVMTTQKQTLELEK